MALGPLTVKLDKNGQNIFALPAPGYVNARVLAASTAETITPPGGAKFVVFSANADFYVNYTTTAAIPTDTTDGSAAELNPSVRDITGVTAISVISAGVCIVTAAFYS